MYCRSNENIHIYIQVLPEGRLACIADLNNDRDDKSFKDGVAQGLAFHASYCMPGQ